MNRSLSRNTEILQRRLQLRKQEGIAKQIPYISFILTHVALVLFLLVAFFIDQLVKNPTANIAVKIGLSVVAVVFLASEWIYAMTISRRWKGMIVTLIELEEEQRIFEEQELQRQHESALGLEQLKNRALQFDLQRRREQKGFTPPSTPAVPTPIRPVRLQQPPFNKPFEQNRRTE